MHRVTYRSYDYLCSEPVIGVNFLYIRDQVYAFLRNIIQPADKGEIYVAPALAANRACTGEKQSVTLVLIPSADSALTAFSPSRIRGILITIFFASFTRWCASLTMEEKSTLITSALTGPSTTSHISFNTCSGSRPSRAMRVGLVVTPSINPMLAASFISPNVCRIDKYLHLHLPVDLLSAIPFFINLSLTKYPAPIIPASLPSLAF